MGVTPSVVAFFGEDVFEGVPTDRDYAGIVYPVTKLVMFLEHLIRKGGNHGNGNSRYRCGCRGSLVFSVKG